jgi:DNA-binding transcriptional LysR family regulator
VLDEHLAHAGQFSLLWPSSRQPSPKLRAFVDCLTEWLFRET